MVRQMLTYTGRGAQVPEEVVQEVVRRGLASPKTVGDLQVLKPESGAQIPEEVVHERCPPRQKSRVELLKANVEPLFNSVTVETQADCRGGGAGGCAERVCSPEDGWRSPGLPSSLVFITLKRRVE